MTVIVIAIVVGVIIVAGTVIAGRRAVQMRSSRVDTVRVRQEVSWLLHRQALAAFVAMLEAAREAEADAVGGAQASGSGWSPPSARRRDRSW